jgi:GT2 family glycosyltransferase/2-polyprenyl-3-methyl-5-hydroxy-6-metoxy-1,4-benzoquinol methylase
MDLIYNKEYYEKYDMDGICVNYQDSDLLTVFFRNLAQRIVDELHPKTVLDGGCAMGHLVAALRDLGVEAYGIDISQYAISMVREDLRPYCAVGSLADPLPAAFPERFDLIVSLEVLEHLTQADGQAAIANLCAHTDRFLFCSTPDDFEDPTHINVQPTAYWAGLFAQNGLFRDFGYDASYITSYAVLFSRRDSRTGLVEGYEAFYTHHRRSSEDFWRSAVEDKERHIRNQDGTIQSLNDSLNQQTVQLDMTQAELDRISAEQDRISAELKRKTAELDRISAELKRKTAELEQTAKDLEHYKLHYQACMNQREELTRDLAHYKGLFESVERSISWRLTAPFRAFMNAMRKIFGLLRYRHLIGKGLHSLYRNGFRATWAKAKYKIRQLNALPQTQKALYTEEELAQQRTVKFSRNIKISILVPLYNTPDKYLREMIQSVLDQTYANWELCLADGSDDDHKSVGKTVQEYARRDSRILYKKLEKNLGISGNTNACIHMATGEYISLFDHDDLLHPAALFEVMKAICDQGADFIYTDENTFHQTPADAYCPHFKPDYAPDTLRANNYICHLTTFQASLLETVGEFRPECDGSQDFDMVLRLTEQAKKIVHIPKILYYWRSHPNSVASGIGAKPYVINAAKKAVSDHLERVGLKGEVLDSAVPSMYRLKYDIIGDPLVSILIPNYEHKAELKTCLESIYAKTTYSNFEILVIENNSSSQEIFDYYEEIQKKWSNLRVITWDSYFNYSAINNFGARHAAGSHLLLLNNDTEVISPDWIQEMLMYSQRNDVGAVGAKLYYPDDTIQHAGLGLGLLTLAGHLHRNFDRNHPGYMGRLSYAQNLSGVTAACVMVRRDVWDQVNGLDETFEVAFNDVDLCMRIRAAGYLIVWTPFAELYHYESKSRGLDEAPAARKRFLGEVERFQTRWAKELADGDPYYNPNFSLDKEDFSIKTL